VLNVPSVLNIPTVFNIPTVLNVPIVLNIPTDQLRLTSPITITRVSDMEGA